MSDDKNNKEKSLSQELFRENILKMGEYLPPLEGRSGLDSSGRGFLLLDFNERVVRPPRRIRKWLREYAESGNTNIYPEYGDLDEIVANYAEVEKGQVMITNGSDQAIDIVFRATVERGKKVIIPTPSFAMFYQSANLQGAEIIKPRYRENPTGRKFEYPVEEVLFEMDKDTNLTIICNPNNPTGTIVDVVSIEKIVRQAESLNKAVLIDEAYFEFSPNVTSKNLVGKYSNVFISRSLSKVLGIAAMRPGYLLSQEKNIKELRKVRGPYDVNMGAVSILKALKYTDTRNEMMNYINEVMKLAKPTTENFLRKNGIKYYESSSNFILIDPTPLNSIEIYDFLKSYDNPKYRGILVRPRTDPPNTFRLTIGRNKDMDYFMDAFDAYLKKKGK